MSKLVCMTVLSAFVLVAACSQSSTACDSSNCQGCCNDKQQCLEGQTVQSCGSAGQACRICNASEACTANACIPVSTSTGGGNGNGTGGGSADRDAGTGGEDAGNIDAGPPPVINVASGSCAAVSPCASSIVGTWYYTQACVDDPLGDLRQLCADVSVVTSNTTLSGRIDITSTHMTRKVSTEYTTTVNIPSRCSSIGCSGVESILKQTVPSVNCTQADAGCDCTLSGASTLEESGAYGESGGVLKFDAGTQVRTFNLCVSGVSKPTMLLRETSAKTATEQGSVTLTKQ